MTARTRAAVIGCIGTAQDLRADEVGVETRELLVEAGHRSMVGGQENLFIDLALDRRR